MSRTISFDQHGDFAATRAAEAWCKENGITPPPGSFQEGMSMAPGAK